MDIRHTAKFAMHNRKDIERAQICGCFHCMKIFASSEVKEWTDNEDTALCPHCSVDAVLPELLDYKLSEEILKKLNTYWF